MFKLEQPIKSKSEDFLGRSRFAIALAEAISGWREPGSLVIGLYGKWGAGKSSILNLLREHLDQMPEDKKTTFIEFNPWVVSGQDQLLKHFFSQIANELEIQDQETNDKKTADKLRLYASLLLAAPDINKLQGIIAAFLSGSGIAGVVLGLIIGVFFSHFWGIIITIISLLIGLIRFSGESLNNIASFFETRSNLTPKTIQRQKDDIISDLAARKRKLLIVIDDLDRLSGSEIKQLIRLVKANSDFPNTVFLLAFQRDIIEKNLDDVGVSGRDYLEKIVQVSFDVPDVRLRRIEKYLFQELDSILITLPETSQKHFNTERWVNLYHSGLRDLFGSLRNIKRYSNSLRFNISMLVEKDSIEVNPIDFIAIEAIRVFCPEYYQFMRGNKELFTFIDSGYSSYSGQEKENKHKRIEESILIISEDKRESVKGILDRIFPGIIERAGYGPEWLAIWNRSLMVRSPEFYDVYFTLTPGGDEELLSQSQVDRILDCATNVDKLENELRGHICRGTIRSVLERIQSYTSGKGAIPEDHIQYFIQALFNISDELPQTEISMYDSGAAMDVMRIAYQFGKRLQDPQRYKNIILEAIDKAKSLSGPVEFVSLETPDKDHKKEYYTVPNADIGELQQACVNKISEFESQEKLFGTPRLLYILYLWKEWDKGDGWKKFIEKQTSSDKGLCKFLGEFISEQKSQTIGDYAVKRIKMFGYQSCAGLIGLRKTKLRIENIKVNDQNLYTEFEETIDLFLANVDSEIQKIDAKEKQPADPQK